MREYQVQVVTFDTDKVLFERVLTMALDADLNFHAVASVLELMFAPIKVKVIVALLPKR